MAGSGIELAIDFSILLKQFFQLLLKLFQALTLPAVFFLQSTLLLLLFLFFVEQLLNLVWGRGKLCGYEYERYRK